MKKDRAFVTASVRGIAFGLITVLFTAVNFLDGFLWAVYIGFFLTMAFGADKNEYPNYLCSLASGYVWSFGYVYGYKLFEYAFVMPHMAALAVSETILTFLLLYVHIKFLSKTKFNKIPAVFAAVATIFASGGIENIPLCGFSAFAGITTAVITEIIIVHICM